MTSLTAQQAEAMRAALRVSEADLLMDALGGAGGGGAGVAQGRAAGRNPDRRLIMATRKRKAAKRAAVQPIRVESGNKVGWETYRLKYHAQLAARRARARAQVRLAQGYDFGYQVPGTMERVDDGWRVCVP